MANFACPTCGKPLSTAAGRKLYCRRCRKEVLLKDALKPDPKKYNGGPGGFSKPQMRRSTTWVKGGPNPRKKKNK